MRAFVLAGGHATRLHPYSEVIPKPLIPVAGKPFIRWVVDPLVSESFYPVTLLVAQGDEALFKHEFRDRSEVEVCPSGRLGTAGALYRFKNQVSDGFLLAYGDIAIPFFSYKRFCEDSIKVLPEGGAVLLATRQSRVPWGIISESEGQVKFEEKPLLNLSQWTGVAVVHPGVLDMVQPGLDWGHDLFPKIPLKTFETELEVLHITGITDVEPTSQKIRELTDRPGYVR